MTESVKFHTEDGSALLIDGAVKSTGQALLHGDLTTWLRAGGEIAPYYTILSAEFSNSDGTAVMARTQEAGRVLITESKIDRWVALQKWLAAGGKVDAMPSPKAPQ